VLLDSCSGIFVDCRAVMLPCYHARRNTGVMMILCETSSCSLAVCMISIVNYRLPKLLPGGKSNVVCVRGIAPAKYQYEYCVEEAG